MCRRSCREVGYKLEFGVGVGGEQLELEGGRDLVRVQSSSSREEEI